MSVFEMAQRYYPRLWNRQRIEQLRDAGKLTETEAAEILAASDE